MANEPTEERFDLDFSNLTTPETVSEVVAHALSSGMSEDDMFERLLAAGITSEEIIAAIADFRRSAQTATSELVVMSGPDDHARLFDQQQEMKVGARQRQQARRERQRQSARLAAIEPDTDLAFEGASLAQLVVKEAAGTLKSRMITWFVVFLVLLPVVLLVAAVLGSTIFD